MYVLGSLHFIPLCWVQVTIMCLSLTKKQTNTNTNSNMQKQELRTEGRLLVAPVESHAVALSALLRNTVGIDGMHHWAKDRTQTHLQQVVHPQHQPWRCLSHSFTRPRSSLSHSSCCGALDRPNGCGRRKSVVRGW